jgi:hypothetical protein
MASATSKPAQVSIYKGNAQQRRSGKGARDVNYYVTEVTTLGDGSIKRETFRTDAKGNNSVKVQEATVKDGKETSNTVSSNATAAERKALSDPRSQLKNSIKQQTNNANKERIKNETDAAAGGLTDAGKKNQEVLGGGSGNNATQPESGDSQAAPPTSTAGTRVFENMQYPSSIAAGQDVIQFTALSYAVKQLSGFTFGGRDRVPVGTKGGRSKGTVTLPIQSGIKDQNAANWGDETMNPAQIAAAGFALSGITGGADGMGKSINEMKSQVQNGTADFSEAFANTFAEQASQVKGLLSRTAGKIINPNLELLFQKPSLRPFSFTFRMSARNADEAKEIIRIIRFFKQNMAPQKGGGSGGESANLFLKAPNTFQVHYLHRGVDAGEEHKFIGRMKECAMTSFEVDYTPDGNYSTYEDGVMTSYTISMSMKELEPVFFEDYDDGDIPADAIGF